MTEWHLHWLEAEGSLDSWRRKITEEINASHMTIKCFVPPPRLDILVQRVSGTVIPEIGMVGHAYKHSLFALQIDPDNENFEECLSDGTLRRQVAHEVHHCMRMNGQGYGHKLGEALVSEGLAGHFVNRLFDSPPELWESALDAESLDAHYANATELNTIAYDHAAWFFGAGDVRPRWAGYSLGYALVQNWLKKVESNDVDLLINVPADTVLAAWDRRPRSPH